MNDYISRQAAIDALKKADDAGVCWKGGYIQRHSDFDEAINCIKELPSAEPKKRKWIPVSERLPKYSDSVLVSVCDNEVDIGAYFSNTWHINECGPVENGVVIAWMPLPEPIEVKNDI